MITRFLNIEAAGAVRVTWTWLARAYLAALLGSCVVGTCAPEPGTVLWRTQVGTNVVLAPALGKDGSAYVSVQPAALVALDSKGVKRWEHAFDWHYVPSAPSVVRNGQVIQSVHGVRAFDAAGALLWEGPSAGLGASVAIPAGGGLLSSGLFLQKLSPSGAELWRAFDVVGDHLLSLPPAIGADGSAYTLTNYFNPNPFTLPEDQQGWYLRGLGAEGKSTWLGPYFTSRPSNAEALAISRVGMLLKSGPGWLVANPALPAQGSWQFDFYLRPNPTQLYGQQESLSGVYRSAPVLGRDETVYFGDAVEREGQEVFVGINPDGTLKWQVEIDGTVAGAAVDALENVYFGTSKGKFMAVNAQGEVAWTVDLSAAVRIPALGPDGRLYVGTAAGELFALQGAAGPAPSSWPQYQRNAQHTGSLESYLEAGGQGEMVLNGIPGRAYRIEWSEGVLGGWQTLTNTTLAADTLAFTDPAANGSARFYRAVLLP